MIFGKRKVPPTSSGGAIPPDPPLQAIDFPWGGKPDFAASNFALANLAMNVKRGLVVDGRLYAVTLMVAIGAIAGFCAQCAFNETMIKTGIAQLGRDYLTVGTADGGLYLFGDALNSYLIPEVAGRLCLWSLVAGAVVKAGVAVADLPDTRPLFASVAGSIGTPTFGVVHAPEGHTPDLQPLRALNLVWPLARKCLTGKGLGDREWGVAAFEHRPAIASFVAHSYIGEVKDVLDPKLAALLVMEAAIICSKLQPATVVDGQF
jgi:hypothetical protein